MMKKILLVDDESAVSVFEKPFNTAELRSKVIEILDDGLMSVGQGDS